MRRRNYTIRRSMNNVHKTILEYNILGVGIDILFCGYLILFFYIIGNGWNLSNSNLTIDWESEENTMNIKQTVTLMRKGCRCKTSCQSSRCKCKRAGNYCLWMQVCWLL